MEDEHGKYVVHDHRKIIVIERKRFKEDVKKRSRKKGQARCKWDWKSKWVRESVGMTLIYMCFSDLFNNSYVLRVMWEKCLWRWYDIIWSVKKVFGWKFTIKVGKFPMIPMYVELRVNMWGNSKIWIRVRKSQWMVEIKFTRTHIWFLSMIRT